MSGLLLPPEAVRELLRQVVADRLEQGHDVADLSDEVETAPASWDALAELTDRVVSAPLVAGWPHHEPTDLADLLDACPDLPTARPVGVDVEERIRTAWEARVAGCVLGKPFEYDPDLAELRAVLEPAGEWPLTDYVTEATNSRLRAPQPQWPECVRERIRHVPEDDDLGYTALATVALERFGRDFTHDQLRQLWLLNLPVAATFGPERTALLAAGLATLTGSDPAVGALNPADEHCGALIRADAYGFACPGDPVGAATLAHRDATLTHRRTGVYAAMWVAAAVATALVAEDWLDVAETAARVVPAESRLRAVLDQSLDQVRAADDWLDAYHRIHGRYGQYSHCRVVQEMGTLLGTLRFARGATDGIGMQVCQGNDTDSFGATAGSLLGALHGPAGFDPEHWLGRFDDRIHLALATTHDASISSWGDRMAALHQLPA
ncbi:MAG: ADP-ribosylglycohydrolase family protein [Mycobacteriales bacterium]